MSTNISSLSHPPKNTSAPADLAKCAIWLNIGVEQNFWWADAITATLVTVQYNITKYDNSTYNVGGWLRSIGFCLTVASADVTNSQTIYGDYSSLWNQGFGQPNTDPVVSQLNAMFGEGYGTIRFLNGTTAIGSGGFKV